ncbi:SH2 domain-containing protein 4A-like [Harmonia axyridis]|uniref:SH2 domain-containing protein 4A-like n=1 Tax=Harmonia axyridis TaxID=115357 RepID=UPI001E276009|nr:SH2 domain-containing protein 4A-like [Harmonia axyridis]XP_045476178.1 SH2 domain-containing protein 4A-like [Harmonia axyridis]
MLQQILRDMYVDPEILAELDEDYKQKLFCKMREEQVRRWTVWTDKLGDQPSSKSKNKKKVDFLKGTDGEPWVWVMGEHPNDRSIEDILRDESLEKARKLAEKEVEAELSQYLTPKIEDFQITPTPKFVIEDDADIYCSVDEIREKINSKKSNNLLTNYSINNYKDKNRYNIMNADVFQDVGKNATQKVSQKVALWEKRLTEERTCQILKNMQKKRQEIAAQAAEDEKMHEQAWREQERKAKEAEQQKREIARRAREEHRLSANLEIDTTYSTVNQGVPPGRQAVLEWFRSKDKSRSGVCDKNGNFSPWFHGLITRGDAEKLLLDQKYGSFLVRLSEKIWGYAISYRAKEKCKHYLINAGPKYSFTGTNQMEHNTLSDLVTYHKTHPLSLSGGETLNLSCPRLSDTAIKELE